MACLKHEHGNMSSGEEQSLGINFRRDNSQKRQKAKDHQPNMIAKQAKRHHGGNPTGKKIWTFFSSSRLRKKRTMDCRET